MAGNLDLVDGLLHVQFIADGDTAYIIEVTRRMSGDFYACPVSMAAGLDWAQWVVMAEAGLSVKHFPEVRQQGYVGRHCVFSKSGGKIAEITLSNELERNISDACWFLKPGDQIEDDTKHKVGILFLRYQSHEEMEKKTSSINDYVSVEMMA